MLQQQVQAYFTPKIVQILRREDVVVFDVGANVGLFSLEVLRRTHGKAKVFSFEPIPQVFETLNKNLTHSADGRVRLFNCGLARAAGTATFSYFPKMSPVSSMCAELTHDKEIILASIYNRKFAKKHNVKMPWFWHLMPRFLASKIIDHWFKNPGQTMSSVTCRLLPLSEVLRQEQVSHIDLLKVDVEKAELEVLAGITDEEWQKIDAVALEVHAIGDREQVVLELLRRHGFRDISSDREPGEPLFNVYAFR